MIVSYSFHHLFIAASIVLSLDLTVVGVFGYGPNWPSAFLIIILLFSPTYQVPYKNTPCALSSVAWKETIIRTGHELIPNERQ